MTVYTLAEAARQVDAASERRRRHYDPLILDSGDVDSFLRVLDAHLRNRRRALREASEIMRLFANV